MQKGTGDLGLLLLPVVLVVAIGASAASGTSERTPASFASEVKPGIVFSREYDRPDDTPIFFSGWSRAENADASCYCLWLDVYYDNGENTQGRKAAFAKGTHGWQKASGAFVPPRPVTKVVLKAVFKGYRGGDRKKTSGRVWFRDVMLERREGTNEFIEVSRYSNRPYSDEIELAVDCFDGRKVTRLTRTVPSAESPVSPIPGGRTVCWTAHSLAKVTPLTFPGEDAAQSIDLAVARRERESAQVILSTAADVEWSVAELRLPGLRTADGVPFKGTLKWERQGYLARQAGYRPDPYAIPENERWFPEPLLPAAPMRVRRASSQGAWVTVQANPDAASGVYTGDIVVTEKGEERFRVPLRVTVRGFELPATFGLRTAYALMDGFLKRTYGEGWKVRRREAQDIMLDHRLNPDDISRFELPDLDDLLHARERGMNSFNILHIVAPPKDPEAVWQLICKPEEVFNDAFYSYFTAKVKPFVEELRKRDLLKYAYFYGFDERGPEFYAGMDDFIAKLHRDVPGVPVMATAKNYEEYVRSGGRSDNPHILAGDWYCPVTWVYDEAVSEKLRAKGKQVWWYTCCVPPYPWANFENFEQPWLGGRILGWQTYQVKADGFLYWLINKWEKGERLDERDTYFPGYSTYHRAGNSGGGILVYPGTKGVLPGMRLAQCRDAVEDYEYLQIAESRLGREKTMEFVRTISRAPDDYERDPAVLLSARERLADAIEKAREK